LYGGVWAKIFYQLLKYTITFELIKVYNQI